MKIRKAGKSDINCLLKIWEETARLHSGLDNYFDISDDFAEHFKAFLLYILKSSNFMVLVSEINSGIAGHCIANKSYYHPLYKVKKYGEIIEICVTKKHRRKGIGTRLVNEMLDWFKIQGITRIECKAAVLNNESRSFWRKSGFKNVIEVLYKDNSR